jgi:hypothetical protein
MASPGQFVCSSESYMAVFVRRMPQTMILNTNVTAQNKQYFVRNGGCWLSK